jgi:antirestriction protein ArdC
MRTTELFERVTRQIATAIEQGAGEYQMPWHRWGEALSSPMNAATGKAYRGINTLMLWASAEAEGYSSGQWATYRQWAAAGAQVRKGQKSTAVLFWKTATGATETQTDDEDPGSSAPKFLARVYSVFNADQVDRPAHAEAKALPMEQRMLFAESFFDAIQADVRHGGDRACYVPGCDEIWMPRFGQFRDAQSYYSVLAHETVHWTGAKRRLKRDLSGRFGSHAYAAEELVAELGAAFVAAHLKLAVEPRRDHAAYLSSWLRLLRDDRRALLTAASKAQQAVDYLVTLAHPACLKSHSGNPEATATSTEEGACGR